MGSPRLARPAAAGAAVTSAREGAGSFRLDDTGPTEPIVTLTLNPTVDTTASVEYVEPDRKLRCSAPRHEPGGGGINVSRAVRELGGASTAIFPAGGALGGLLCGLLDADGVAYEAVPIRGDTRENFIVGETATGRQYRFGMPGPVLSEAECDACLARLAGRVTAPGYVVASGSLPPGVAPELLARVARVGAEAGARVVVDTSGPALRAALGHGVFLLKPNLRELAELAGHALPDEAAQDEAARALVRGGGAGAVVVSLGAAGALLAGPGGEVHRIRSPTVPIRSRVGAGDSMVAGMVLALARGASLRQAALFGVAAGAAAVMTEGTELCRREDTERLHAALSAAERGAG